MVACVVFFNHARVFATYILYSEPSDGSVFSNGSSPAVTTPSTNVGIIHTNGQRSAAVFVFQLPASLLWDEVLSAQLDFYLAGKTNRPVFSPPAANLDVHVLPLLRSNPSITPADYYAPAALVHNDLVTPASLPRQWYSVQNDSLAQAIRYALAADFLQTHRYLLVRISYDAPVTPGTPDPTSIQYYTLSTFEAGASLAPRLIIEPTHHPEPGTLVSLILFVPCLLHRRAGLDRSHDAGTTLRK